MIIIFGTFLFLICFFVNYILNISENLLFLADLLEQDEEYDYNTDYSKILPCE